MATDARVGGGSWLHASDLELRPADFTRAGPWQGLLAKTLTLTDHLQTVIQAPTWSFGGGTVLMLRLNHRYSKDIDLFVPDPQYLGHVSPRLSDVAEAVTTEYQEAAEFTKLLLPEGEIDFVVGTPLTQAPWEEVIYGDRRIHVESCAEIIAKKMHFRGARAKARDLFDLCAVAELEPDAIPLAMPFMTANASAFISRLREYEDLSRDEFEQIDRIQYDRSFDECLQLAEKVLAKK
jgi:predicted nucleotidyltransferase component of viral defense system